jgi:hypothetical protein
LRKLHSSALTGLPTRSDPEPVMSECERIASEGGVLGSGRRMVRIAASAWPEGGGLRLGECRAAQRSRYGRCLEGTAVGKGRRSWAPKSRIDYPPSWHGRSCMPNADPQLLSIL